MGTASSSQQQQKQRRPVNSWSGRDGWVDKSKQNVYASNFYNGYGDHGQQQQNGRRQQQQRQIKDEVKRKPREQEASPYKQEETRDMGHGNLGVASTSSWSRCCSDSRIVALIDRCNEDQPFTDPDFAADNHALYYSNRSDPRVVWKRPCEIVPSPRMQIAGLSREDIMQGGLGDCWFLSSCAAIAQQPQFMKKVVPGNQALYGSSYKGSSRFRFWRFGEWVYVYIDDRLPTKSNQLMYAKNSHPNEFWVALIEKAYAKLHGSYEAIEGGQSMDALVDLTGGIAERYELKEHTKDLFQKMARANASGAFITCSRKGDWKSQHETVDQNGLVAGHAYTISDIKRVNRQSGAECLVRVRNPWGTGQEWTGAWSDGDARWDLLDEAAKEKLKYKDKEDGEFWMSYKDFCTHFQEVTVCTVGPDFDGDGDVDASGKVIMTHGAWKSGISAGGCRNDLRFFATNPQYLLTVTETDSIDPSLVDPDDDTDTCSVVIALMQEHRRSMRKKGLMMLQIGFIIYKTDDPNSRLSEKHFMYNYETAKSGTYVNFREVCGRFELNPGYYVVIPSAFNPGDEGTFLLRIYSNKNTILRKLPDASTSSTNNRNNRR